MFNFMFEIYLKDPVLAWAMAESHFRLAQLVWETYDVSSITFQLRDQVFNDT